MIASTATIITFLVYLIGMLLMGWLGYRATSSLSDYILGGRRLGSFVTAISAGASDMSGWLLMGLPGAVFLAGISEMWVAIGLVIGAWLNWRFVAAKLRLYTEKCGNALTLPDYFTNRFQDSTNILRIFTALAILVFFTIYCAAGVVAGGRLFQNMFGMPYETALWVGAFATISYVFIGGFLAVSWTDTIQGSLMITALILTPLMLIHATGGMSEAFTILSMSNTASDAFATNIITENHLAFFKGLNLVGIISLLGWGLGYFGQPHILVRFMAAESIQKIPNARRISMTWMILCLIGSMSVGLFGAAYFTIHVDQATHVMANAEVVFIEAAKYLFNPWITGFLLAAILAAVMSTLSCQLLVCSSALTEDIYRIFLRKTASQKELVWFGRAMVLAVALFAIWIASNPQSGVLKMVSYAWAGFGAAFGPVIVLSLIWRRMTAGGAIAGIITGTITVIVWKQFHWFELYEIIPGFAFCTIAIIIFSFLGKMPPPSVTQIFDEARSEMRRSGVK